jgi:hypothetical protein
VIEAEQDVMVFAKIGRQLQLDFFVEIGTLVVIRDGRVDLVGEFWTR